MFAEILLALGIAGGASFSYLLIITLIQEVINHFKWKKVEINKHEKDYIIAAISRDNEVSRTLTRILGRRGLKWSRANFDKQSLVLKIIQ
jgi:hypothetical protein